MKEKLKFAKRFLPDHHDITDKPVVQTRSVSRKLCNHFICVAVVTEEKTRVSCYTVYDRYGQCPVFTIR